MELKPGYKQTDVGFIPEEWEIKQLKEVAIIATGNTPPTSDASNYGDEFLFVGPVDIGETKYIVKTEKMLSRKGFLISRRFPKDSILFVSIGSTIGKCGIASKELTSNQQINAIFPSTRFSSEYLYYAICAASLRIKAQAGEQAVPIVNKTQFSETLTAFPPLPEQRAIASALSDVDSLLEGLDKLIAKKRDLKQAAMQELLTGKCRLPGFDGEWEVKRLGELGDVSGSGVDKKTHANEQPVRLLNYMDVYLRQFIYSSELEHWVTASSDKVRKCAIQRGDVFFTPSSETRDDIGLSAVAMEDIPDACYSYHIVRLRLREHWDLRFRAYAFQTRGFLSQAEILCDGGGTRYVVSLGKFRSMTVQVPPLQEQAAIGQVLSDMDAEIDALEQRRKKTKDIKQAMMQELLTGKTRLV